MADSYGDQTRGQTAMENCLQKNPDINVVYTINEPSAAGAFKALKAKGKEKSVILVSVDGGCQGVRDVASGAIIGSTRYHDIVPGIDRVEIGYTWYAQSRQRTHVNTTCKRLLLGHAFDTLGCKVVGLRTDNFNFRSQRAIEALGAKRDGVIRHHHARRDGTVRDSVMYSILAAEWPDVKRHLATRLLRGGR